MKGARLMVGKRPVVFAAGFAAIAIALGGIGAVGADAEDAPVWRGQWTTVADELTVEPRTGAAVAVAPGIPHGVVVWGGVAEDGSLLNDGVLIDSGRPGRWRVMPEAPLVARRDFGWASVGDRVYIWGGVDEDGEPLDDGAEFQHGWTMLPTNRLPAGPASMAVADNRLWVVAADSETGQAKIESAHLPVEDAHGWGLVADVPLPAGDRYVAIGCCGDEANQLIVFSVQADGSAVAAVQADGSAVAASWDIGAARNPSFIGGDWTQLGTVPTPIAGPVTGHALEQDLAAWASSVDPKEPGATEADDFMVLRQIGYGADDEWWTPPAPLGSMGRPTWCSRRVISSASAILPPTTWRTSAGCGCPSAIVGRASRRRPARRHGGTGVACGSSEG